MSQSSESQESDQEIKPQPPSEPSPSKSPRLSQTLTEDQKYNQNQNPTKKQLNSTLQPRVSNFDQDFLERNKDSPYLKPINGFGNCPPPPLLKKCKTNPSLTQPIRPSKIYPPTTARSPRRYNHVGQENMPYSKRAEWQAQSEANFFNMISQKYQQTHQFSKIYSTDFLKKRQLSIERVSTSRKKREIEDRRQRIQECKEHQRSIQNQHDRYYNDEIYSRTGKQFRYIPNYDRCNPANDDYIFI